MNRHVAGRVVTKVIVAVGIIFTLMAAGGAPLDFASKPRIQIAP